MRKYANSLYGMLVFLSGIVVFSHAQNEFLFDTVAVYGPAVNFQRSPSVAFDGDNYFVVWEDWREPASIYGARVNPSGIVLDSTGVCIVKEGCYPMVAFDNANYLLVWSDEAEYWLSGADLYGTRIEKSGHVIDSIGFPISEAASMQIYGTMAFDGTNYLVVWEDWRNYGYSYPDIYAARVTTDGVVLDPNGIAVSAGANNKRYPSVSFDGTNYLVVWQDDRSGSYDIYGTRINQSGAILDPGGITISNAAGSQERPSIAFDGVGYLSVWQDQNNHWDIFGARIDTSGNVLDSVAIPISSEADSQCTPKLSFDGTNFLVAWVDYRVNSDTSDIYCARLDPSGNVLDSSGIIVTNASSHQLKPALSFDDINYLIIWEDLRTEDIYGARVEVSGNVLDTASILVSMSTNYQESSALAFDGTNYLAVWQDWKGGTWEGFDIYGSRVSQNGNILDSLAIPISINEKCQRCPVLAFATTHYLVAWEDYRYGSSATDIFAARVDQSGCVLDTNGIPISVDTGNQESPAIASDGTNYLIVWVDEGNGSRDLYGARIDEAGNILDSLGFPIAYSIDETGQAVIAFGETEYFVIWHCSGALVGAFVTQSGIPHNYVGLPFGGGQLQLAFDGNNYMITWREQGPSGGDIYGARINQNGILLDPGGIIISNLQVEEREPVIAFNGTYYLVAWENWRNGLDEIDIYGAIVDTSGSVVDSFFINNESKQQIVNAVAHGNSDQLLISYTGWAGIVNGKIYNAKRIWGKFFPFTGIEEKPVREKKSKGKGLQIYPNIFRKSTTVYYFLEKSCFVSLAVYDKTGRLVKTLEQGKRQAGYYATMWNGSDYSNGNIPTGIYFVQLKVGDVITSKKVILIR